MMTKRGLLPLVIGVSVLILLSVWWVVLHKLQAERRVLDERFRDVKALVMVCFTATNILNTEELLAEATRQRVVLKCPAAKDRSKPCHRMVNPWRSKIEATQPQLLLIAETNVTDPHGLFIANMEGSVNYFSTRRIAEMLSWTNGHPSD